MSPGGPECSSRAACERTAPVRVLLRSTDFAAPRPRAAGLRTARRWPARCWPARCWPARCWPAEPGAEAALDAALRWSVPVEFAAAQPITACSPLRSAGLGTARHRPVEPGAPGSVPRFVLVRHRPRVVVRKAAWSYPHRTRSYATPVVVQSAPLFVTRGRPGDPPAAPGYDRALPGTTARLETPNHRRPPTPPTPSHTNGEEPTDDGATAVSSPADPVPRVNLADPGTGANGASSRSPGVLPAS